MGEAKGAVDTAVKVAGKIMESVNKAIEKTKQGVEAGSIMQGQGAAQGKGAAQSKDNGIGM